MSGLRVLGWAALVAGAVSEVPHQPVLEFDVDLDAAPHVRFTEVITHFNASIQHFYSKIDNFAVKAVLRHFASTRGPEPDELRLEIEGVARLANVPAYGIAALQQLYELNTLMVPIENITWADLQLPGNFSLPQLPIPRWSGPGCTGILAMNKNDGMVYHARNLDFSPASLLQDLVYTGIFKKGGKELFRAQMIAAYSMPLTALKKGPNGFSYEINTRFLDHKGGNSVMWKNLFTEKRPLNGWVVRKALEESADYEAFVEALSTTKYVATMYSVIGGVKKGTILARNPDGLAYKLTLGEPNYHCRDDYIIITNFDYFFHDVREWFDPTGGHGIGHPRRNAAEKILNASSAVTPEVLWTAINDFDNMAKDTIFQAIINVETGLWNVSKPACAACPKAPASNDLSAVIV